jgi:diguanylate cyclase (GGDEF)-like protein/PAS domain S-box-containing protein
VRAVTPVFDEGGKIFGMVVINMDVRRLLTSVQDGLPEGVLSYVADQRGRYLLHPDAAHSFGFDRGDTTNIVEDFPILKSRTDNVDMSAVESPIYKGYLAARRIFFDSHEPTRFLTVAYHLPEEVVSQQALGVPWTNIVQVFLIVLAIGGGLMWLLRQTFLPLQKITSVAHQIAMGHGDARIPKEIGGEIGELTDALNTMLARLSGHELLERENAFRKELIESLPGVFYMLDSQGNFMMWNHNLEQVLQLDSRELAATHPLALFVGEDVARIENAIRTVFESGEVEVQASLKIKSGKLIPYHFTGRRVLHDGSPVLIGMGLDITEQRESMRVVVDMLRRNQALMNNSMEGVHVMDTDGNVLDVNDSFCRMLGYTREEALHLNVGDWDDKFSAEELRSRFKDFIGKSGTFETVHKRKDGSLLDVEICTNGVEIDGKGYLFASSRDVTERKKALLLLLRHKQVIDTAHDGYWLTDMHGNLLEANLAYAELSGYSVNELVGMHISQLEAKEKSIDEVKAHIAKVITHGYDVFETQHRHKDGHVIDIEVSTTYLPDTQQLVVFSRDISERKQAEEALRVAAAAFETHDAILITDTQANIIRVNSAFTSITGYAAEEVLGRNPRIMSSGRQDKEFYAEMWRKLLKTGMWAGEIWDRRKNGEIYPKWLTITAVKNEHGQATQYVAIFSDITARKMAEEEIRNLAFYDALTQLPNRRLFQDRLQAALLASVRHDDFGALLFIDLDRFKLLNDTLGHDYGDMLLIEVAVRIKACIREIDTVARLGGDEFVVLLESISTDREDASRKAGLVAEKIRESLAHPYQLKEHEHYSSPSIGIALFHDGEEQMDELIKHADAAMYQAKDAGRNTVCFYDPDMQKDMETRALLENDLRRAIENHELHLYYQMQVDNDRRAVGAEALLRWIHPQRGLISPVEFIPVAEDSSLIIEIGNWVLETACAQLAKWNGDPRMNRLTLAVNVSSSQFRMHDFVEHVAAVLHKHGAEPSRLKLELTESVVLNDLNDVGIKMQALRALGVQLSLDDFGTGYSSLAYLKRLPLDQIKIDRSFIRDITVDQSDAGMVQTIIDMAKNFKQEVIAEGVETEAQLTFLRHNDCMAYQGYFFSKPVPVEEMEAMIRNQS